jgi:nitrile hydratase accessory protein
MATLSPPDPNEEPAFEEPWQAQAFALAVQLSADGAFTWSEWTAALAAEIARDGSRPYFEAWLSALETLALSKGLTERAAMDRRKADWAAAYQRTPHGRPVEL